MPTQTTDAGVPSDYDPSQYPAFAVTVDVVSHPAARAAVTSESTAATRRRVFARTRWATGSTVATAEWLVSKHHSSRCLRLSCNKG